MSVGMGTPLDYSSSTFYNCHHSSDNAIAGERIGRLTGLSAFGGFCRNMQSVLDVSSKRFYYVIKVF